ncbi:NADH-quinone oxidoreductase subunit NuoN [Actinomyces respiraculi]|uniref:NADH-quinone oxidoreductase subunit NuoN n=1 Tax=Actinomyces respiraculi TaxID=2744574 RepID=UPI00141E8DE0|nr:NADH-quinone oxidoreductase subunit NuoN [Actinomyces respiraculi]
MSTFTEPAIYWAGLAPALVILGTAVLGVLVEAFVPRRLRLSVQTVLALAAIMGSFVLLAGQWALVAGETPMTGEIANGFDIDPFGVAAQGIILVIGLLAVLTMADRTSAGDGAFAAQAADRPGRAEETESLHAGWMGTEALPLTMFSLGGMMLFPQASNLIALFVMLELVSLPLYIMAAMARHRRLLSQEAALKYFVLGAFSSAFLLLGSALLYGATGSVDYSEIAQVSRLTQGVGPGWIVPAGLVLLLVGLLFKIAAAPFHSWSPDVYQGSPTPVTGFMAAGVKATAFLALVRVLVFIGMTVTEELGAVLSAIAVLTMLVGTVVGIVQRDVKRMLAYSAIAHAGYMLIALISINRLSLSALLLYSLAYGVSTVGAFGIISLVRVSHGGAAGAEATDLDSYRGLGQRAPWLAAAMTVFMLSLAGIPLTAGFVAKYELFLSAALGGGVWLVVAAVVSSAATAFFYMRLIVLMYFRQSEGEGVVVVGSRGPVAAAVTVAVVLTLVVGILPQPLLTLLGSAAMLAP